MTVENPFTDEFMVQEIKFMGLSKGQKPLTKMEGIEIRHTEITYRCDDYLNKNWRAEVMVCPIFFIDGMLWMSLTPMEVESNYLAWQCSEGVVGMGGLGIGYTTLRAASKDEVTKVLVFEEDMRVVKLFKSQYADRPEMDKIVFVMGDARETMKDYTFDFVYMDIYQTMLPDEAFSDVELFRSQNKIKRYKFWGQEKVVLAALEEHIMDVGDLDFETQNYLSMWMRTEKSNMYAGYYGDIEEDAAALEEIQYA
jgi:hypothetical protein